MSRVIAVWSGQLRAKGIQYVMLTLLTVLVSGGFYASRITESYIFSKWTESAQYADVIVSYKGSPLQIVASTLFRMENPTGNIDSTTAAYWEKHPMVAASCPVSLGDNIQGYPLIGTSLDYFDWMQINVVEGHLPNNDADVVVDVSLAETLGLSIGDELHSSHGGDSNGEQHDHHHLQIVGLVQAPRNADQQAFFTTTTAYYGMHNNKGKGDVTALMLRLKSKSALVMLPRVFDQRPNEQGAFPVFIFAQLQKQWTPTLATMKKYSVIVPVILLLMFGLIVAYLNGTEKESKRFYTLQKLQGFEIFWLQQGLSIFAVLVGTVLTFFALNSIAGFYIHKEQGAIFLPLLVAVLLGISHSKRP